MSDQESPTITRYLLGQLPREEVDALEARLLTEAGLFELAESVEDEVIDRYVRGELSSTEARRFERRLLPSERIRERVEFARALAARGTGRKAAKEDHRAGGAVLLPLFRKPARLAWAATLAAALAAGVLAVEVARLQDRVGDLDQARIAAVERLEAEAERAQRNAEAARQARELREAVRERLGGELSAARVRIAELEAGKPAEPERRVRRPGEITEEVATTSLFLALATRSGAEPPELRLGDAQEVELLLDLGGRSPSGPVVATLFRDGEPVSRPMEVDVDAREGESIARLVLPAEFVLEGSYVIRLTEAADAGSLVASYELFVTP